MVDGTQNIPRVGATRNQAQPPGQPYDGRRLSYAGTFTDPRKAATIRAIEWITAKPRLLMLIRRFERQGVVAGQEFFNRALRVMGIEIRTPAEQIARIPREGPVVVVANHPHGLTDGLVMAALVGRVRTDYQILTRSLLTGIPEIEQHMLPVAFPHEPDAQRVNIAMRQKALEQLRQGGVIILFPAGAVATSPTWWGPAVEPEWNPFTAKLLLKSGASVLPIYFPGQNSRLFMIANRISPTFRQGLLLHEIRRTCNRPQCPVIGHPIPPAELQAHAANTTAFMAWLRARTLALASGADAAG